MPRLLLIEKISSLFVEDPYLNTFNSDSAVGCRVIVGALAVRMMGDRTYHFLIILERKSEIDNLDIKSKNA